MNILWTTLLVISIVLLTTTQPNNVFSSFVAGGEKAISLSLKLWAIYAVWLGLLNLVQITKLDEKLSKLFHPLLKFLFGNINNNVKHQLSINLTGNIFGIGSASMPSGIEAMHLLYKEKSLSKPSYAMAMLILLNTSNLQIIPSTVIGLRLLSGSNNATSIILPSIIVSIISLTIGITLVKLFFKRNK